MNFDHSVTFDHPAAKSQLDKFIALAAELNTKCFPVGQHFSKSIKLPVVSISLPNATIVLRDNGNDLNVSIDCDTAPNLDLGALFEAHTWDWYLHQIQKKRGYTYKHWTEEEVSDPRILRVLVKPGYPSNPDYTYWSKVSGEAKDRWILRMEDPSWYGEDWSNGALIFDGPMGPGSTCYHLPRAFAEGISDVVSSECRRQWRPGRKQGLLCLQRMDQVILLARMLADSH